MATVALMGRNRSNKGDDKRSGDRHKPGRQMRVHPLLAAQLDVLAERNATTAPQEANRAIRELLEREGLWPLSNQPPKPKPKAAE